jgi:hypothetical protein
LRSVNYARLSSGRYRFQVRAMRPDGAVSAVPAIVAFTVLPALLRAVVFIALAAGWVGVLALLLYRVRVAQLLRVERVRIRASRPIFMTNIGASLSQIAIQRKWRGRGSPVSRVRRRIADPLDRTRRNHRAASSNAMSDIVWAINPEVDTLSDLVHRIRRFVEDTLGRERHRRPADCAGAVAGSETGRRCEA